MSSLKGIDLNLRILYKKPVWYKKNGPKMGIRGKVSRSTLADANENRDWRIYRDFAHVLIHEARNLYVNDDFGLELDGTVYALDSSTIDLCLSSFPWAQFRRTKFFSIPIAISIPKELNPDKRMHWTVSLRDSDPWRYGTDAIVFCNSKIGL